MTPRAKVLSSALLALHAGQTRSETDEVAADLGVPGSPAGRPQLGAPDQGPEPRGLQQEMNDDNEDESTEDDEITDAKKEQLIKMRVELCRMVSVSGTWDVIAFAADRHTSPLLVEIEDFQVASLATQSAIEDFFNGGYDDRDITQFHSMFLEDYNKVKQDFDEILSLVVGAKEGGKKRKIKRHISEPNVEHEEVSTGAASSTRPINVD